MNVVTRSFITLGVALCAAAAHALDVKPVFQIADGKASLRTGATGGETVTSVPLKAAGRARFDRYGNLLPTGGAFLVEGIANRLAEVWATAPVVTWTAALVSESVDAGTAMPLAIPGIGGFTSVLLLQQDTTLILISGDQTITLGEISPGMPLHVAIVQTKKGVAGYLNGKQAAFNATADVVAEYSSPDLTIGTGNFAKAGWRGHILSVAAYTEAIPDGAIGVLSSEALDRIAAQTHEPNLIVKAKPIGRSDTIPLDELAPYTQSLTVYAYSVVETIKGDPPQEPLYVAHWAILDSTRLPFDEEPSDDVIVLRLDEFTGHPELQAEHISDSIVEDFSLPLYYDMDGVSLRLDDSGK